MKTVSVFCEVETISKYYFTSHKTIFFPQKCRRPKKSPYILTPEGKINLLKPSGNFTYHQV
jgi:hypothetical protein